MSKQQVESDYQKLLWERNGKILRDKPKSLFKRLVSLGTATHYEMPMQPLDEDFSPKGNPNAKGD